jgi:hypothetical protein
MVPQHSRAERFRARADECDWKAKRSSSLQASMQFRDLARQWRLLADQVEHIDCARSKVDFGGKYP